MASHDLSLLFLLPTLILHFINAVSLEPAPTPISLPSHCKPKCGNITVPYPFGFQPGCFREQLNLVCNESYNPPKLFLVSNGSYEIIDISLLDGEIQVYYTARRECNNSSKGTYHSAANIDLGEGSPYLLSLRNNVFTIGCPSLGYYLGSSGSVGGCVSSCKVPGYEGGPTNGSCSGVGCCQSLIPHGLTYYEPYLLENVYYALGKNFTVNPTNCSYAFLADSNWFNFDTSYLSRTSGLTVQVALDWAITNVGNCSYAKRNLTDYACRGPNSYCHDTVNGDKYRCNCLQGFEGNPYMDGCQDVNECALNNTYPCYGVCTNTIGSYDCSCPKGTKGNASTKDSCRKKDKFTLVLKVVTGVSVGIFLVTFACFSLYLGMQKRKLIRTKQRFFEQNGGVLLQQQMRSSKTTTTFRIYSKEELEKATDNFSDDRVLGRGGHGIVYKGILEDGTVVAIKKSKLMEEHETKEFAKEMLILSQINHKNVVKLFGSCLEVEVPMLVYEYISNGTLYHYLHDKNFKAFISSDVRLRIAAESADALAYMHSSASPPILHGDVKSANVLLNNNFVAKVSDFGASKLAPNDEVEIATLVQGTCGYLDPEYLITCRLTDKSDVYSFAVVILELITRKKALYFEGSEDDKSLASSFCTAMKDRRFLEILDAQVRDEIEIEALVEIGDLVMQCLSMNREERPTMREVSERLERIRRFQMHNLVEENAGEEETESLLGDSVDLL
ncbi:hypothetical protein LUZ60_006770 [Juncus effusus]|nr:hypothetical protein LUZ60_006770 [Juncus effusus]